MSEIKTDKIIPVDAGGTSTLGCTGDTIATGAGTTLNIQGTYSGINSINWDTTAKTTNFTAETNRGYFINTTSGSVTISLPATPVAGSFIGIKDYALTAQTNPIIINPNGNKIQGSTSNFQIVTQGGAANLVYVDSTQGWLTYDAAQASDISEQAFFVTATGGTITTCGDYKIHTFTGPGTFCVSCAGNPAGSTTVDYLVVAGGGGGGVDKGVNATPRSGGGGGAGGYRESKATGAPWTASPLASSTSLPVSVTGYPITVGGGGAAGLASPSTQPTVAGDRGSNSIFSTIISTGGGGGMGHAGPGDSTERFAGSTDGGSGGGYQSGCHPAPTTGVGNSPPVSPPQGNPAGEGGAYPGYGYGGGGGATAVGSNGTPSPTGGGAGGTGANTSISGSSTAYAGGGGSYGGAGSPCGTGAAGNASSGTTNRGGGGGGNRTNNAGAGGSGIVIIRYRYQ